MTIHSPANAADIVAQTRYWLETVVVANNLCPFAQRPFQDERVRFIVTDSARAEFLLEDLLHELKRLHETPVEELETTLLIHPGVLENFHDYNDFLDLVDELLVQEGFEGEFQIASFHPDYQFADTQFEDAENYTNRSPWPMLHILREASLETAIAAHPDVAGIPERNIALMEEMGSDELQANLERCFQAKP
ncbi:MAG: DUF1415 domain-containing protein [Thiolinea sp.]